MGWEKTQQLITMLLLWRGSQLPVNQMLWDPVTFLWSSRASTLMSTRSHRHTDTLLKIESFSEIQSICICIFNYVYMSSRELVFSEDRSHS